MKKLVEFKVGTKFKYMGNSFPKEYNRVQEVLHIVKINGEDSVRAKFLDNEFIHIFDIGVSDGKKNTYSSYCYPLDIEFDNGVPMFWDDFE